MTDKIHVVTTETIPGYEIKEVKGMVWGTTVRAKFVGKDILAIVRILLGGEVKEYTQMVNEARLEAIKRMVANAKRLGADAIVASRTGSTSQIMPGAVELFSYGTAVTLKKKSEIMNDIVIWFLLGFAGLFGFVFKDILGWFKFELKKDDYRNVLLFFPAFFFLLAFWMQPIFTRGQFVLNDITKISQFYDGLYLWIAIALFVGSGARLLFDWFYNKSR